MSNAMEASKTIKRSKAFVGIAKFIPCAPARTARLTWPHLAGIHKHRTLTSNHLTHVGTEMDADFVQLQLHRLAAIQRHWLGPWLAEHAPFWHQHERAFKPGVVGARPQMQCITAITHPIRHPPRPRFSVTPLGRGYCRARSI
jgi:hypothetical protein